MTESHRPPEEIARVLVREGVTNVFGIPGGYTVRIFDGLYDVRDRVRTILARHEQSAACMADIAGRITGAPAVLMGQGPFIGSSGAFGVMEAFLSGSPMVVIADLTDHGVPQHAPMQSVTGDYGTVDLPRIFSAMTKFTTVAATPNEAVHGVELALHHAVSGRPGPTAVLLRRGAVEGEVNPAGRPALRGSVRVGTLGRAHPDPTQVQEVARLLTTAQRPVVIAGNGVRVARAYQDLQRVADAAGCAVVTTLKGKGAIDEEGRWSAGSIGAYGSPVANHALAGADVVLVLGSRLNPNDTFLGSPWLIDPQRQTIVQVDVEPRHLGWTVPVALGITADLGVFLEQLAASVRGEPEAIERRAAWLSELRAEHGDHDAPALRDSRVPMLPQRVVSVLSEVIEPDHRVVLDAGNNRVFAYHYFRARTPGTFFMPGGMVGMGWGPPAAAGAALVDPGARVVSLVGDGGMYMSIHVLSTAVEHRLPVTFVVMNNQTLANVRDVQKGREIAVDFPPTDFAAIAQAFGAQGRRIERDADLADAVKEAAAVDGPVVLDVAIDPRESLRSILQRDPTRARRSS